jgi:hypothetical protein
MKPSTNFGIGDLVRKGDLLAEAVGVDTHRRLGIVVSGPHPTRLYNIQFIDERGLRSISTLVHISQLTKVE